MKIFGYILAFYLFALAAAPCCSFDSCPGDEKELAGSHEKGDSDCGNCSPFFSCEGCAAATVTFHPVVFDFFITPAAPVYADYIQTLLPQRSVDFWQPPKIG